MSGSPHERMEDKPARLTVLIDAQRKKAFEALCAAQGIEFRAPLATSAPLQAALARLRAAVPSLEEDRYLAPDLEAAATLVRDGALTAAAGTGFPALRP